MLLMCQHLDKLGVKYSYFVNGDRHHGCTLSPEVLRGYLVISVDFDILDELPDLVANDVVVISLDHHSIQDEPVLMYHEGELRGIVINNQYPFEPKDNRYQSGAGVVYEALCELYPDFASPVREALVGVTLLSDARPIENPKARKYLAKTYSADTSKGYIGYLVDSVIGADFGFGRPRFDRSFIDFTFSPRVNSLLRFNLTTEAINFVLGKGLTVEGTKEKQSELLDIMRQRASYLRLENCVIIALNVDDFKDCTGVNLNNFIGLLASNIKGTGQSVLAFTHKKGKVTRASFRGRYDNVDYRQAFEDLGINAQGHPPAFGILDFAPTQNTWVEIDSVIKKLDENHVQTAQLITVSNLSFILMQRGLSIATENCYVRDMFRTYIAYRGKGAKIMRTTYKSVPLSSEDVHNKVKPDKTIEGVPHKYIRDENGNLVPKYIEYCIDGKIVKSFGVLVEDGVIMPIVEKGSVQLYVCEKVF